jgi:hypothetical protein
MTIRYSNGSQRSAVLVARTEFAIRVAIVGSDDLVEYRAFAGRWMSEAFEPVEIDFYSIQQQKRDPFPTVEACICPPELAAQLIESLLTAGSPSIETMDARPNRRLAAHI